jgi:hypothetical protein
MRVRSIETIPWGLLNLVERARWNKVSGFCPGAETGDKWRLVQRF